MFAMFVVEAPMLMTPYSWPTHAHGHLMLMLMTTPCPLPQAALKHGFPFIAYYYEKLAAFQDYMVRISLEHFPEAMPAILYPGSSPNVNPADVEAAAAALGEQPVFGSSQRAISYNTDGNEADIVHCHTWYTHLAGIMTKISCAFSFHLL